MAGWFLEQGSPVGLGLTKVKLCWGTEPEAPQMKINGGSGRGPDLSILDSHSWTCQDSIPEQESGTQLAPSLVSVCFACQWHSAAVFPSCFSCLIAGYNGPLPVVAVVSVWSSCCKVQNAVLGVSWACGWVLLLCWQQKCFLLLNLIFWAFTGTRAVSWLVKVWLQPLGGSGNYKAGACRMRVHGEA